MDDIWLETIDCAAELGPERYWESAPTHIVKSPLGVYRELPEGHYHRFAYRFQVAKPGTPHLAVINYPDDKTRTMCVMDGRTYDLSTGIGTGLDLPLSDTMRQHRLVFWPRFNDCSLMFINYGACGGSCAVASIELYELKSLPNALAKQDRSKRTIGLQWEDPAGKLKTLGARSIKEWASRLAEHAAFSGQNLIEYPISWYYGPLYPSEVEKPDFPHFTVDEDGGLLSLIVEKPADWVGEAMDIFAAQDILFKPVVHLQRLASLLERGGDILNVRSDGQVQCAAADWTRFWSRAKIERWGDFPAQTGHEPWISPPGLPSGPMYNLLHPVVQDALFRLFAEIGEKYGKRGNFAGVTVPLWGTTFLWFGSLESGYDDLTFSLFEKETGLRCDIASRYDWVKNTCLERWIDWRCGKVKELLVKLARLLPGPLTISVCPEPLLTHLQKPANCFANLLYNRESLYDICKLGGLDFDLYDGADGVKLELQLTHSRYRHNHATGGQYPNLYWDYNFLDKKTFGKLRGKNASAYVFNCYYEGGHYDFKPLPLEDFKTLDAGTGKLKGVREMTLNFSHPLWPWYPHEFTTGSGVPPGGRHFLEHYAHALAEFDAPCITQGGLTPGLWGHEAELREFSAAFTALPSKEFAAVGESSDPVALRVLREDGIWFYLVNRESFPVKVVVRFPENTGTLRSLPSEFETRFTNGSLELKLESFGLLAFRSEVAPSGFVAEIPQEERRKLTAETERLLRVYDALVNDKCRNAGSAVDIYLDAEKQYCTTLVKNIALAASNGMFSYQRRLLFSLKSLVDKSNVQACLGNQEKLIAVLDKDGRAGINCGSAKEFQSPSGTLWLPDQPYNGFGSYGNVGAIPIDRGDLKIDSERDQELYRTEACGDHMVYRLPLPPGSYNLRLHFAETYHRQAGKRALRLNVDNQPYPKTIDPFAAGGGFAKPFVLEFKGLAIARALDVELTNDAELNGIEVERA